MNVNKPEGWGNEETPKRSISKTVRDGMCAKAFQTVVPMFEVKQMSSDVREGACWRAMASTSAEKPSASPRWISKLRRRERLFCKAGIDPSETTSDRETWNKFGPAVPRMKSN